LSYLGYGAGPVEIRYVVRRLRRILPDGTKILVAYWDGKHEDDADIRDKLFGVVQADAYASTLHEAVAACEDAALGEPMPDEEATPTREASKRSDPVRPPA
jgi:hypothetical protein